MSSFAQKRTAKSSVFAASIAAFILVIALLTGLSLAHAAATDTADDASDAATTEAPAEVTDTPTTPTRSTVVVAEETYSRVTLSAVGDNLMHMPVVNVADAIAGDVGDGWYDFTPMYAGVADIVSTHDLNFIDQETILGGDYLGLSGYPTFNSPADVAASVADFGWNLVTTATNHSWDMGITGIENSCATWAEYPEVIMAGTYTSWEDRGTIRVVEKNGIRFAFLAYEDYLNGYELPEEYGYAIAEADADVMIEEITRAHELADVVIVAMSWGSENAFEPNETQLFFAQHLANLGVDLVLGFGPHVIQPVEWYYGYDEAGNPTGSKTLVVFSLGNFLSNQPEAIENVEGCFTCAFERVGDTVHLVDPTWIPLVNHAQTGWGWYEVYQLADYSNEMGAQHWVLSGLADPVGFAYDLTYSIIDPEVVRIAA